MSRSNPTVNTPHPCGRWFQWDGADGVVFYYDKDKKENLVVGAKMQFVLVEELAAVRGWHEPSKSGIVSNEVKDQKAEPFAVRAFKGGPIATGFYRDIKEKIKAAGGHFTACLYLAYRRGEEKNLSLGCLQIKGAALNAWVDFFGECGKAVAAGAVNPVWEKSIRIEGFVEGKKGAVTFRVPVFKLSEVDVKTNNEALALEKTLTAYLTDYFKRTTTVKTEAAAAAQPSSDEQPKAQPEPEPEQPPVDDDVPF